MSNNATSITIFQDAVGLRASITYSKLDDTGTIVSDNNRIDKVIVDSSAKKAANSLLAFAQDLVEQE